MLNEEQIYDLCLELASNNYDYVEKDAGAFLVYYIVKQNPGISDEEVNDKILDAVFHREAAKMVNSDMLEVDFTEGGEVKYVVTPDFYTITYKEIVDEIDNLVFSLDDKKQKLKDCWEQMEEKDRQNLMTEGYATPDDIIEQYALE